MRPGLIDVGQIASQLTAIPATLSEQGQQGPQNDPPKVNGTHTNGTYTRSSLSVGQCLAAKRRHRSPTSSQDGSQDDTSRGVPLDLTLDLIHELTHNQRQYRPDKDTGGVNVSILHLPEVVGTALGRIKAKVPIRCGLAPIVNACVDWGLKGLGQYPAIQRLLWLKATFNEREEAHRAGHEEQAGLTRGRSGRSLYGLRGQCLQKIFRDFPSGLPESEWRENVNMPLDTYTDLKEVMVGGLGLRLQDAAILATMYTLVDVAECEATKDVTVEEDRVEMRTVINKFLDHVQVRAEASEFMMRGWGMLADKEEGAK